MSELHQPGVVSDAGPESRFLVLTLGDLPAAIAVLSQVATTTAAVVGRAPGAHLTCTVAFSAGVMERLVCGKPAELTSFTSLASGPRTMPATQADALVHINGDGADLCFELAHRLRTALGAAATVVEETHGFRYFDKRDLTGFIDGTENPAAEERAEVASVGDEDAAFAGGSYVLAQRYVHHLSRWAGKSDAEQERIIGRTKPDSVELDDKPNTAHISRVVIEENGEELEIVRHSMPYGCSDEHGLFFLAYCRTPSTFIKMLERMVGLGGDGEHDHLLDFVTPKSGHFFFAPSAAQLKTLTVG